VDEEDVRASAQAADAVAERAEASGDSSGAMLARAIALMMRQYSGDAPVTTEPELICRAALPLEEKLGDSRRLALLWEVLAAATQFRMQIDACVDASEQALHYHRVAGDTFPATTLDWGLVLGPRPADEGLRMLDDLAAVRPPGAADFGRAALLAMLGRIDEAWQLAEARSEHLREVTGGDTFDIGGHFLPAIAMIEGDRVRACRLHAELIDALPPGSDGVAASYRLLMARDLCYLGRFDEADPLLRQAQAVPPGPFERVLGPAVEALLFVERGELERAEELARACVSVAETETDNPWLHAWAYEDLATVLERAGRIDEARETLERALAVWERKRCLPYVVRLREQIDALGPAKV
jgi:tetratricopeptide (TPR) repeat protein